MAETKVFAVPEGNSGSSNGSIDATTLLALGSMGGGGFGGFGGMNPLWIMFMYPFLAPFFNGMGYNGFGGMGGAGGTGFLANQLNNNAGRDLILQAINGRADALGQIAGILNTSVETVKSGINSLATDIVSLNGTTQLTGAQIINAIQSGNAALGAQVAQCCCENRLAICQQTNDLKSQAAANHSALQLQLAQANAADQLAMCQQTNQLGSQADRNTNSLASAIATLQTNITKEFCDIRERELQSKIATQSDIITQLRGQLDNDRQTAQLFAAINPLQAKVNEIANKQPNTVPVQWPNLTAVNNTPYAGGYPYGLNSGWNGSFWG